jgi:hypothetical protein
MSAKYWEAHSFWDTRYILADIFSDILNNYYERISKKTMKRMIILQEKTDAQIRDVHRG